MCWWFHYYISQEYRNSRCKGCNWHPQFLAAQLTLFETGSDRLCPPIATGTPIFFHLPAIFNIRFPLSLDQACSLTGSLAPNPADCGSYLICNHKTFFAQRCAPGLHWDNNIKACNFIQLAGCESGEIHRYLLFKNRINFQSFIYY